jgi:hypothetical protein
MLAERPANWLLNCTALAASADMLQVVVPAAAPLFFGIISM